MKDSIAKHVRAELDLAAIRMKREIHLSKDIVDLMHAAAAMQHEMEIVIDLCQASNWEGDGK